MCLPLPSLPLQHQFSSSVVWSGLDCGSLYPSTVLNQDQTIPELYLNQTMVWSYMVQSMVQFTVWTGSDLVTICDTRLGNQSCDRSGDLSPTFSKFVYICLCLFTYVWSLDLLWKLYIVPTLRELTSLSFNINHDTPVNISSVWGRPGDWGAST